MENLNARLINFLLLDLTNTCDKLGHCSEDLLEMANYDLNHPIIKGFDMMKDGRLMMTAAIIKEWYKDKIP